MGRYRLKEKAGRHIQRMEDGSVRVMLSGEEITCHRSRLGNALDKFDVIDPDPPDEPHVEAYDPTSNVKSGERPDGKGFDVFNAKTGEPINDEPLTGEEAKDTKAEVPSMPSGEEKDDDTGEGPGASEDTD